jgi:RsiW-degrading membrane proteinase PrsW (M82 family)
MDTVLLLILAVMPGIILLYFIMYMDRNEREPLGQVLIIVFLGAVSAAPAAIVEYWLQFLPIYDGGVISRGIVKAFVQVAWVEELCKLGVVLLFAWNSKQFDEENDGIVYVGASALGFAMLENVAYVLRYGMSTGITRALTAMPLHCFTGVLMGYYVGVAKFSASKRDQRFNIIKGFMLAYLIHGAYDALLMTRTPAFVLIFPLIIWLVIFGIKFLKKGRALSLVRASEGEETTVPAAQAEEARQRLLTSSAPKGQLWKIIISRTLLTISAMFWGTVFFGVITQFEKLKSQFWETIAASVMLSFLPLLIGVMLEVSYRKKKRLHKELERETREIKAKKTPEVPVPAYIPPPLKETVWPPGQLWRTILARTLLTVSALFWVIIIMVLFSNMPGIEATRSSIFLTACVLTLLPIYTGILLEDSYRKRKKRYIELLDLYSRSEIPPKLLEISPPGQLWKIIISRFLFALVALYWSSLILAFTTASKLDLSSGELIGGAIFTTAVPAVIGILLEKSYQKKKKQFLADRSQPPTQELPDQDLNGNAQLLKEKRVKELWSQGR